MRITANSQDLTTMLLMDGLSKKNDKSNKNKNSLISVLMPTNTQGIKYKLPKPDWNMIPSKDVAMSEEEFEEAIRALALKTAEKGMAMEDIGKATEAFRLEEKKLLWKFVSVASPDRKAAYENYRGNDYAIYGNPNQELLRFANGAWGSGLLTKDELSRCSKFYDIYQNTMKEYEAEHGKIPEKGKSNSVNPYQKYTGYNTYNLLNQLA
ncbi:MAG: hypothetical protein LBU89_13420 [Fibromonadaceae bacterium]|jgi:hypothetical protein|nr:hypothetical protein [Fibromonadaceae bacterium]